MLTLSISLSLPLSLSLFLSLSFSFFLSLSFSFSLFLSLFLSLSHTQANAEAPKSSLLAKLLVVLFLAGASLTFHRSVLPIVNSEYVTAVDVSRTNP